LPSFDRFHFLRGLLVATGLMAGAAHAQPAAAPPEDPFQKTNRGSFAFSMGLDRALLAPVAHTYVFIVPSVLRQRVSSAVSNLEEPGKVINHLVQAHPGRAARSTSRFLVNSTLGVAGLFDVATGMGLPPMNADFGQTLGRYGVTPGPYLYMPIVGPLSMRDGFGRMVDLVTDPLSLVAGGFTTTFGATRLGATVVDRRVAADSAFDALKDATDPYAAARSAYLQYRQDVVRQATGEAEILPDFDEPPTSP